MMGLLFPGGESGIQDGLGKGLHAQQKNHSNRGRIVAIDPEAVAPDRRI
jgi:hypothetical protein